MFTPTEINDAMSAAILARRAGDFDTAIQEAEVALGMMGAVADQEKGGFAGAKLSWDRNSIDQFINQIRRSKRASKSNASIGGLQITKLRHVSAEQGDLEEYV